MNQHKQVDRRVRHPPGATPMPALIAHRGEPEHWPENSLAGFDAVLNAGAAFIETDVQLTADLVPVLCHDDSLVRMTGHDVQVTSARYDDIRDLSAGDPERFGERFSDQRIVRLADLAAVLARWPEVRAFIEIKPSSIQAFGSAQTADLVLAALGTARAQSIPISFDYETLLHVRDRHGLPVGWILPEWSASTRQRAAVLAPDYLFVDHRRLPQATEPLWSGPWQWAAYTVNAVDQVRRLAAVGFDLVETNDIRRLMREYESASALPV